MGTARGEMLTKQNKTENKNRSKRVLPKAGTGEHPWQGELCLGLCPTVSPFLILSFGHKLGTRMVNKQVIGKGRAGRAWGGEQTPLPPSAAAQGLGGLCTGEDAPEGGHCLKGLSGATLPTKIFTCIYHARARHARARHTGLARHA